MSRYKGTLAIYKEHFIGNISMRDISSFWPNVIYIAPIFAIDIAVTKLILILKNCITSYDLYIISLPFCFLKFTHALNLRQKFLPIEWL